MEGQTGTNQQNLNTCGPFSEYWIDRPQLVKNLPKIVSVCCGMEHSLALADSGQVFGWGSNAKLQLSHAEEFVSSEKPLFTTFVPIEIVFRNEVLSLAAGAEFSIFITRDRCTFSIYSHQGN